MSDPQRSGRSDVLVVVGIALVAAGAWLTAVRLDVIPPVMFRAWSYVRRADDALALIAIGVAVILLSRSGSTISLPAKGTRLYKSRSDKWVFGVLGGLARYFGLDPAIARLAYLAFALLVDFGSAMVVYFLLAVIMPQEPSDGGAPPQPPAAPKEPVA
ncbi:MAG: PspC domain-containing protein [Coriobacteriales bacterium]|nr:PspC domain-containing protein [Actinomycetes bacterium]